MAFIGIDRGIRNHWIYKDSEYFHVWFEMISCARYTEGAHHELIDGELVELNYGEFIFGRIKWSERLGISEQRLRTFITKLVKADMIVLVNKHRKCTVYKLQNYEKFNHQSNQQNSHSHQVLTDRPNQQTNQSSTSSQPAANQQLTTYNKDNKDNKETISTSTTTEQESEFISLDETHRTIFGHYNMNGLISGFIVKYMNKGFDERFIHEVLMEAAESCNNGKPSVRQIEAIAERWERDRVFSRAQNRSMKGEPTDVKPQGLSKNVRPFRTAAQSQTLSVSDDELDEIQREQRRLFGL